MENIQLSLFKGYSDTCPQDTGLQQIVHLIRTDPTLRDHTEKHRYYRSLGNTNAAGKEKSSCPCFAVAVRFAGGKKQTDISACTTLSMADFDGVSREQLPGFMELLRQDPYVVLAYITISGEGLRILYKADCFGDQQKLNLNLYPQVFEQGNRHYADLLGCAPDGKCKNITRLSGMAADANVYFNPAALPFPVKLKVARKPGRRPPHIALEDALPAAQAELERENIRYEAHQHNEYIMRMGYLLNAYGVAQEETADWATDNFTDYDGDVAGIIRSCYQKSEEHGMRPLPRNKPKDTSRKRYANVGQIEEYLLSQARFRQNTLSGECEIAYLESSTESDDRQKFAPLADRDVNSLWRNMNNQNIPVRVKDISTLLKSDFIPLFDPFGEFIHDLKPWDGTTDYIGQLTDMVHIKGSHERFAEYFRKWFVGILPAFFDQGVTNHEILVFVGEQGIYKTTWLNLLLPPSLQRYFYTKVNSSRMTKDDKLTLAEFILICLEEIDEMTLSELNQLKAMTGMKSVNERAAYRENKEHRPHIASYCGTGNNLQFLNDPSGNRRWLPFEVISIDDPYTHPFNYEGIYSQAYALWKSGFRYWFSPEEIEALKKHNSRFEAPDLEKELVLTYFRHPLPGETGIFASTAHILGRISGGIRQMLSPTKIGIVMRKAGFEPIRLSSGQRGYRVVEYTQEEIFRNRQATARFTQEP